MKIKVYHNGDDTFIAWNPEKIIPGCRGFALMCRCNGKDETVSTWVGFEGQAHTEGERHPSTKWPIQKYQWSDYMANPGDRVQYRVIPMTGTDKDHLTQCLDEASDWTDEITLSHTFEPNIEGYFNRGIVASQWVSRRLGVTATDLKTATLKKVINTQGDPLREYLFGPLGARLIELLADAAARGLEVYTALFELDDLQLQAALLKLGMHAHIVLANGSVKTKGEDENKTARTLLKGKIDLYDRMCAPRALGHNKFMVICDTNKKPRWVWTGSLNWSDTGLCTQANNSVYIDDAALAADYLKQWNALKDAGDASPHMLKVSDSVPWESTVATAPVTLWFTPTLKEVDLEEARQLISGAQHAILFLMFNPGPKDSLLNQIIATAQAKAGMNELYVRGALNQDPSTTANPLQLFHGKQTDIADFDVVLPASIDAPTSWFSREMTRLAETNAMVHSKVVVIDPFSANPVLMTGSHNLGPKASGTNDENLLLIRNAPHLAAAYATNVMSVYNQYRWRFRRQTGPGKENWQGLKDNDTWQSWYLQPGSNSLKEIQFWVGE